MSGDFDQLPSEITRLIVLKYTDIPTHVMLFHTCRGMRAITGDIHYIKKRKWRFCDLAAAKGYLDVLKWMYRYGYVMNSRTFKSAALHRHFEVLQWSVAHSRWKPTIDTGRSAVKGGSLEIIAWLSDVHKIDIKNDRWTYTNAAQYGHINILELYKRPPCVSERELVYCAAKGGQLETLITLIAMDYSSVSLCEGAARGGHLELLKMCRERGYPWGNTANEAMNGNHMKLLVWALDNGCPWIELGIPSWKGRDYWQEDTRYEEYRSMYNNRKKK